MRYSCFSSLIACISVGQSHLSNPGNTRHKGISIKLFGKFKVLRAGRSRRTSTLFILIKHCTAIQLTILTRHEMTNFELPSCAVQCFSTNKVGTRLAMSRVRHSYANTLKLPTKPNHLASPLVMTRDYPLLTCGHAPYKKNKFTQQFKKAKSSSLPACDD